jgi:hypothetical protein
MVATQAQQQPRASTPPAAKSKPIPRDRMTPAAFVHGDLLHVTLFGDERLEEGPQDIERWSQVGPDVGMHQWLEVTNDAGSFWALMRVERCHGGRGQGLRALSLRFIFPPTTADLADEPVTAIGDWYVRHGGAHRKWMVVTPQGVVRRQGLNTEAEARDACNLESRNPRPL